MPPKAKFTEREIIQAALRLTEQSSIESVTARELGKQLGSSARPIFTVFQNMEEIKAALLLEAKGIYGKYVEEGLSRQPKFKGVGLSYIRFAIEHPELFRLLFMRSNQESANADTILPVIEDNYDRILQSVQEPYGLDPDTADRIYRHLWTYTHGIATMLATGLCSYTPEQIEDRLTDIFRGLLMLEKSKTK